MAHITITGQSSSRLFELEKHSISSNLNIKYLVSQDNTGTGVNTGLSVDGELFVYYISGISYIDTIEGGVATTTFSYVAPDHEIPTINTLLIKNEGKHNLSDEPIIKNNVFINRQEVSVFENNYRLQSINNILELEYYAGGGHFNIVKNT